MLRSTLVCFLPGTSALAASGQESQHDLPPSEKLGSVSFPVTCASVIRMDFNRSIALLHSFGYTSSRRITLLFEKDPVSENHAPIKGKPWLGAVPIDKVGDGAVVGALTAL